MTETVSTPPTPSPSMSTSSSPTLSGARSPARDPRAHRRFRWIPYSIGLLLIVMIVWGLWPKPPQIEIAQASLGRLRATINEEGKTRIRQRYVISAPVTGQLRRVPFKAGADIDKVDTVVAVIEPLSPALLDARSRSLAEARRDTASAQLGKARAAQSFAASELSRVETLRAANTVSVQELENAQWRETAAARELTAAESALRLAEAELAEFSRNTNALALLAPVEVPSPVTGRVLRVFEESTRPVTAGMPLLEIGDPADLEVVIECLSRHAAMLAPGTPVEFEQWGGDEPLRGRVRLIEPAAFTKISALGVEEQRVNVIADLITPRAQRGQLGDQFRVEARIITWENEQALKIPAGALFRVGDQWAVFLLQNGRARRQLVKSGQSSGTETQILEGLRAGDTVILYPGDRVKDGMRVQPIKI
jgi:HlyD family secretion protein